MGYLRFSRYYGGNYVSTAIFFVRFSRGAYPVVALDIDIQIFALASSCRKYYTRNILIIVLLLYYYYYYCIVLKLTYYFEAYN